MCPVPRTTNGDLVEADPKDNLSDHEQGAHPGSGAKDQPAAVVVIVPDQYILDQYDFNEETNAYQLSQVDCAVSMKLNRHLAANCRNISDEVFPGIHLGDRSADTDITLLT